MIRAEGLTSRAGEFTLSDISFTLPARAWGIVVGPAGAGKTTLLETIAGVRPPARGTVHLRGRDVTRVPPEQRGVGIVYQRGYLFAHLTVSENVRYGAADVRYSDEISARFGADQLRDRPVGSLSGGERQLVALARALAPRPDILLLDEPFAALDQRRRTVVRRELQTLWREQGITVLQVTHDLAEAGTLGDLALLMVGGRLVQVAAPEVMFREPATAAAAEFLGAENVYAGMVTPLESGDAVGPDTLRFQSGTLSLVAVGSAVAGQAHAVIRGADVLLSREHSPHSSARNVLQGTVVELTTSGVMARVTLDVDGTLLVSVITASAVAELALEQGARVLASVKATSVHLC